MLGFLSRYSEHSISYKYFKHLFFVLTSLSYISIIVPLNE